MDELVRVLAGTADETASVRVPTPSFSASLKLTQTPQKRTYTRRREPLRTPSPHGAWISVRHTEHTMAAGLGPGTIHDLHQPTG